jgi:hypothetical protein
MKTITGKIQKVWGCITTCEDRLIVYQVVEEITKTVYYILSETSIELNTSYTYLEKDLPNVIQEVLMLCQLHGSYLHHNIQKNKYVLYGPHLTHKTEHVICEIPADYMNQVIEYKERIEDAKIKLFYKWLDGQLRAGV